MSGSGDSEEPSHTADWLRRAGFFQEVFGYAEAVDLLSEPRLHARFVDVFKGVGVTSGPIWEAAAASLLSLNGEEHKRFRSIVAGHFTPRAVERLRPSAHDSAHHLIAALEPAGRCEFVAQFAAPYVKKTLCTFVGFRDEEATACWQAVEVIGWAMKDLGNRIDDLQQGLVLLDYARSALAERRQNPAGDILTFIADEVTSGSLPEPVAIVMVTTLLSAGLEPTINQLAIMLEILSKEPDVWDALGRGDVAASSVVEAVLRLRSTNPGAMRRVSEAFDYRGVHFNEDAPILICIGAANHDPRHFVQTDHLDLDAKRSTHLAFGFGPHYCLGAALARVQLQEAIGALARRLTCPVVENITQHDGGGLIGPSSLELSFSSRGRVVQGRS